MSTETQLIELQRQLGEATADMRGIVADANAAITEMRQAAQKIQGDRALTVYLDQIDGNDASDDYTQEGGTPLRTLKKACELGALHSTLWVRLLSDLALRFDDQPTLKSQNLSLIGVGGRRRITMETKRHQDGFWQSSGIYAHSFLRWPSLTLYNLDVRLPVFDPGNDVVHGGSCGLLSKPYNRTAALISVAVQSSVITGTDSPAYLVSGDADNVDLTVMLSTAHDMAGRWVSRVPPGQLTTATKNVLSNLTRL